ADGRQRAPRADLLFESRVQRGGKTVLETARSDQLALEVWKEDRICQLIEPDQIVPTTDHLRQFGPAGLGRDAAVGTLQRGGQQPCAGAQGSARHPAHPPGPTLQAGEITERSVAAEQLV